MSNVIYWEKKSLGVFCPPTEDVIPFGFRDSDWGGDMYVQKFISLHLFQMVGKEISWASRKRIIVLTSTSQSEYISMCAALKKAVRKLQLFFCRVSRM